MAKLIFITTETEHREANKIEFTIPEDLDVWEYKRVCMRMASAMGYTSISVKKAFGYEYKEELETQTTKNLMALYSGSNI